MATYFTKQFKEHALNFCCSKITACQGIENSCCMRCRFYFPVPLGNESYANVVGEQMKSEDRPSKSYNLTSTLLYHVMSRLQSAKHEIGQRRVKQNSVCSTNTDTEVSCVFLMQIIQSIHCCKMEKRDVEQILHSLELFEF